MICISCLFLSCGLLSPRSSFLWPNNLGLFFSLLRRLNPSSGPDGCLNLGKARDVGEIAERADLKGRFGG